MTNCLQTHDTIYLWPNRLAPGAERLSTHAKVLERSTDLFWPNRIVSNISQPSLTAYIPKRNRTGAAVVIAPGGAYGRIVLDKEAAEMAVWLNSQGIVAFILQYRLPCESHLEPRKAPFADAQRALRLIKSRADDWGIDRNRIGFLGCSAGGHLGAMLAASFDFHWYDSIDETDTASARPDFLVLLYPVVSMLDQVGHAESRINLLGKTPNTEDKNRFSAETLIGSDYPATFIVVAKDDDCVSYENSCLLRDSITNAGNDCVLHLFNDGGHGFGIRDAQQYSVAKWTSLAENWLSN